MVGSIYLVVRDFKKSLDFYEKLLSRPPEAANERFAGLGIEENLTEIRYINVFCPYWYFTFTDPDGNPIEITVGMEDGA